MKVSDLSSTALAGNLRGHGIRLRTGPFVIRVQSAIPGVAEDLYTLYRDYPLAEDDGFADFHVRLARPRGMRRWLRSQVLFFFDNWSPFKPLPLSQAFPMFEWGLNWCIAGCIYRYLILHAAVVARDDLAVILPGAPGAGKSTLCAGLVSRGWRLLSDEMAVIDPADGTLVPVPRPVNLKNDSIAVIREFAPAETIGRSWADTRKGTVAHMRAPAASVAQAEARAMPAWVIAPRYEAGAAPALVAESKARMFMNLATNAFNYHVHGPAGFALLGDLINRCACYRFGYGDLDRAMDVFDALPPPPGLRAS